METITYTAIDQTMFVSWQKRLLNLVIDAAVIFGIIIILGIFAAILALLGFDGMALWFTEMDSLTDRIFTSAVIVFYYFTMEITTQRTVGKLMTGTKVVMEDGSKPLAGDIMKRALCRLLLLEILSFINATPRGWHDTASDTYVIDAKKYKEALEVKNSFDLIGVDTENLKNA